MNLSKSQLNNLQSELVDQINALNTQHKKVISVQTSKGQKSILFRLKEIKINNRPIQIISFENIKAELDLEEERTWKKVFRVLTHEIMNSITPIASLTQTLDYLIKDVRSKYDNIFSDEGEAVVVNEVEMAISTIHKRSTGLLHFVESYRNLTRIPKPNYSIFKIKELLGTITSLMKEELKRHNINCNTIIEPSNLELSASNFE